MNMNKAVLHVGFAHDVGGVDALYGSPSSTERTSFHASLFGLFRRVPMLLILLLVLLTTPVVWAAPDLNTPGERVNISSHLVADKTNVVLFYARWNKTSMRYKEKLESWKPDKDTVVHFVDVKAMTSPVAKQFKITELPAFEIYDEEGNLKMKGQSALNEVVKMKMLE